MENVIVNDTDITKYVTSFEVYDEMDQDSIIGSTVSTQIKLKLNNKDGQLDKYLDYPFFIGDKTYTVYEKPSKWTRTISLVLYDKMILTNIPYVTELPETTTIEAQLDEMAQLINISIDKSTLSSDILNRTVKWQDKTLLIRTYIGYIAQLDGKNAFIENDVIKFKSLAEKRLDIDFCSDYEINEVITFTRVYYDNGTVIYSRGNRNGNTIYLDSNNRYINESDVERIFSQYDHLSFYSFKKFRCWKTQDIDLTDLITYNGMTFMPIGIKRTVNGGEAKDSLELSGDIQIKNAEDIKVSTNPNEEIKKMVVDQIEATKAEFDRLNAEYINVSQQLVANRADINTLNASVASIEEAYISKAEVSQLYATKAEVGTITSNVAEIQKAIIDVAYIDDLNVLEAKINEIIAGSVTTEYLEANYAKINLSNIENGCITTAMIGDGVIGTVQIADGSITDAKIVGLTANKLTAGTIDASDIEVINLNCANLTVGTINGQQIANNAIDWDKLNSQVSGSITQAGEDALEAFNKAQEAANAAGTAQTTANGKNTVIYATSQPSTSGRKTNDIWFDTDDGYKMYYFNGSSWVVAQFGTNAIKSLSITNALIADGTIQNAKIANLDAGKITSGYISADRIQTGTIVAGKLATDSVSTSNLQADSVNGDKIAANSISAEHINANAITSDKIVSDAITGDKIASKTITADNIVANTITSAQIKAGTITSNEIDAGSIRTVILIANSITSTMINSNAITSDKIAANAITSAKIATDAIKSRNYVANSTGSYLNMSDGSFSSKNLKWSSNGTITATNGSFSGTITANSGAIGGWKLSDTFIYNDYDINSTTRNRMYLDSSRNAFGVRKEVLSNGVWKETTTVEYTYIGLGISNGNGTSKYTKVFLSEDMLSFTVDKDKNYSCNYTEKGIEVYGRKEYASFKYNNGKRGFAIDYSLNVGEDVAANRFLLNVNGTNQTLLWADSSNDWATRLNSGNKGNGIIIHGSTFHDANIYINAPNNNPVVQFNTSDSQMLGRVYFDSNGLMKCRTEKDVNTMKYIVASTNLKEISYIYNSGNRYVQFMSGANLYGVDVWVSDRRLKRNILDSKVNALDRLMRIRHCSYILNDGNSLIENGYIADELEIIDKNLIFKVGEYKQPSVQHLIPLLSKSIQEQQLIINGMINDLNQLNAKLDAFINGNFQMREVIA